MPHPRFEKLSPEKRERILVASAKEFRAHGFEGASLSRILAAAGISKGAAYYYFDDKADLFDTVVRYFVRDVTAQIALPTDKMSPETFWQAVQDMYVRSMKAIESTPWMAGLLRASFKLSPSVTAPEQGPLSKLYTEARQWAARGIRMGQHCGAVRADLPEDLLIDLALAIDQTLDRWLDRNLDHLSHDELSSAMGRYADSLRRILEPAGTDERSAQPNAAVAQRRP